MIVVTLAVGLLVACGDEQPTALDTTTTSPLPTPAESVSATEPLPSTPLPDLPEDMLVPFRLDRPLRAGDTHVRGSGPPGVPIVIANVTRMGDPLVYGEIGADGRFDFELPDPLEASVRIGVALGDLSGEPWNEETFQHPVFNGEGSQTVPQVGFFYDTTQVEP
jgi:hypothetical protein